MWPQELSWLVLHLPTISNVSNIVVGSINLFTYRLCFDQPEADPGAEDNEGEWCVDLEQEEAGLSLKEKVKIHTRVIPVS